MKKNFSLTAPGKANARVVEAVKHEVRKYVKRERRKALPDGFTQWHFSCRAGNDPATAQPCELDAVAAAIDRSASSGSAAVYIEILAQAGHRPSAPGKPPLPAS